MNDDVYYKLYVSKNNDLVYAVCMQWFDEPDYATGRFLVNPNTGAPYQFPDLDTALVELNRLVKPEKIAYEHRLIEQSNYLK